MDENEEKEYNDIESLAAYLHSGKMQAKKAAEERAGLGLPPETDEDAGSDLEGVLFTLGGKKRKNTGNDGNVISRSEYDSAVRGKSDQDDEVYTPAPRTKTDRRYAAVTGRSSRSADETPASDDNYVRSNGNMSDRMMQKTAVMPPVPQQRAIPSPKYDDSADTTVTEPVAPVRDKDISDNSGYEEEQQRSFDRKPHKKPEKSKKAKHRPSVQPTGTSQSGDVTSLAESLSVSLGEKAAEIAEKQKDALPPEDTPEIYDITEGSPAEEEFDRTATRLMNAVNDPQSRNGMMREEMELEREEIRAEKMQAARMRRGYERQKQSTRTLAYILIAILLCAAILGAAAYASSYVVRWALDFTGVGTTEFKVDVEIPKNADIETVAAILAENNIINDAKFFKFFAGLYDKLKTDNQNKDFIAGKYSVSSTMSYSTLLKLLRTEVTEKKTIDVRIVEGMTAREIGKLLEENNVCFAEDFEKYYKNIQNVYDFERRVKESPMKLYQLEGYLFPDTYQFYIVNGMESGVKDGSSDAEKEAYEKMRKASEDNAKEAAKKMYSNFNDKITRSMYKKMGEMHMTLDEVVALASIVQKEAAYAEDMQNVASVFLNRIRHSAEFPYLQSDVTVLYAEKEIKPFFKGSDAQRTKLCNAYNTYVCEGIPSGAVCNPGLDAINAVLYSSDTPYFYFCANEETGEIFYAVTKEEHEQNLILAGLAGNTENIDNNGGESGTFE